MKIKQIQLIALLLSALGLTSVQAQTLYVKESSGTQTAYTLSNVQKMTFSSGSVTIQKSDNSTGIYVLGGLRYLSFKDYATGIEELTTTNNTSMAVYPNPVSDILNIDLTDADNKSGTISILSLDGKVMLTQPTTGAGIVTLNIGHLPKGMYLCRYNNANGLKTVKIIKE